MARHKELIDQTIINFKERYPDMDAFLSYDYLMRFDILHKIIDLHEQKIIEVSKDGIPIQLPFIGRLIIKQGKIIYNEIEEEYIKENNIDSKYNLTQEDRDKIRSIMRTKMLEKKMQNKQVARDTSILTFKFPTKK